MATSVSIQLSARGRPSAFDLSPSNDIIVVTSPGCMTFFHLNGLGAPRHVIHYEQPQQIRKVKYQKEGKLATLRGGIVSFWDPFHSLRPLLGLVQSSGWITDIEWSPNNNNMIASACDQGEVRIFDIRAASTPLQQLSMGGACSSVSWCSSDSNLIAACNHDGFNVWDTRMLAPSNFRQSSVLWSDRTSSLEGSNKSNTVYQLTWTHSDNPCLITASTSSRLTWWDGKSGTKLGDGGEKIDTKDTSIQLQNSPIPHPISCTFLAMPAGRGILTANRVAIEQNREPVEGPSTIPRSLSSESVLNHVIAEKTDGKGDDITPKVHTLVDVMGEIDHHGLLSTPIWINSFPRKEYTLTTLFEPPSGNQNESLPLVSSREQIALCREPILGLRWCPPGRLLPPSQGGLELILLSSVNSTLHALSLSPDLVDRYTSESGPYTSSVRVKHHDALKSSHRTPHMEPTYKMNPPKYSISSLKRNMLTPKQLHQNQHQHQHESMKNEFPMPEPLHKTPSIGNTFYGQLQNEILLLEKALESESLSGLSISRIDQYARQITLEMVKQVLTSDVDANERRRKFSNASQSRHSASGDEDDEILGEDEDASEWEDSTPFSKRERDVSDPGDGLGSSCAVLIVSFVHNINTPSFTVRSLFDSKANETFDPSIANSELESELESVVHASQLTAKSQSSTSLNAQNHHVPPPSSGFLLDVARFFRNRALQVWGGVSSYHGVPLEVKNTDEDHQHDQSNETGRETDLNNSRTENSSPSTKNQPKIIDPLAYRVPCPRTSGGIFSTLGYISCFGGSRLLLKSISLPECLEKTQSFQQDSPNQEMKTPITDSTIPSMTNLSQNSNLSLHYFESDPNLTYARSRFSPPNTTDGKSITTAGSMGGPTNTLTPQRISTVAYPRTFGDLLVYQRDAKINSMQNKRMTSEGMNEQELENENSNHDKLHLSIKTTERYYGHFFQHSRGHDVGVEDSGSDSDSSNLTDDDSSGRAPESVSTENNDESANNTTQQHLDDSDHSSVDLLAVATSGPASATSSAAAAPPPPPAHEPSSPKRQQMKKKPSKKPAIMKESIEANNPPMNSSFSNPKEVVIFHILGIMTRKLAKEYSFAVYSSPRNFTTTTSNHELHLGTKLINGGYSDSNLSSAYPSSSFYQSHHHNIPRSGSLNNLTTGTSTGFESRGYNEFKTQYTDTDLTQNSHPRRSYSTLDLTHPILPPSTPPPTTTAAGLKREISQNKQFATARSSSSSLSSTFYLRNGHEIALTCRFNAQLTQSLKLGSLFHIWTMLAVCFEMLSIAGMEYNPSASIQLFNPNENHTIVESNEKKIESCRRMVISGLSHDWSKHALGRPLLRKIFQSLSHIGDLQTLSTITCTLGGARTTAYYLDDNKRFSSQLLDRMLLRYADILHRWQCHVEATEVAKYISEIISDSSRGAGNGDEVTNHDLVSMKLEIKCMLCDKYLKFGAGQWCQSCKQFTQKCGVCEQLVRGFSFCCANCGHGGHPSHLKRWFEENVECPTGCGCQCGENFHEPSLQDSSVLSSAAVDGMSEYS